jgi:hypothetical protein
VFVLPPRAMPTRRVSRAADRQAARALADALANLQESLRRVRTPELRAQIERSLEAVRQAQVELRGLPRPAEGPVVFEFAPMGEFAAEVQAELAAQARALREVQAELTGGDANRRLRQQWEADVRALNAQTDAFRREADWAREEAERALRTRLGVPWPDPPDAPAPPAAPDAPAEPAVPAAPPWSLWFESDEGLETGDADTAVGGVRDAVLGVLETEGRLARLGPDDSIIVAVDFLPRPGSAAPTRTLVLRASVKDIEQRRAGRLAAEEFRRRVQASEY